MNIEEIPYIARYFDVISQSETIFNELKNKYPELEIDLLSSRENPNCQCKNRVIEYLTVKLNLKEDESFIRKLIDQERDLKLRIDENWKFIIAEEEKKQGHVSMEFSTPGKVYTVEKNETAWADFVNKIRSSLSFQSFSVVDKDTHLEVYFI